MSEPREIRLQAERIDLDKRQGIFPILETGKRRTKSYRHNKICALGSTKSRVFPSIFLKVMSPVQSEE